MTAKVSRVARERSSPNSSFIKSCTTLPASGAETSIYSPFFSESLTPRSARLTSSSSKKNFISSFSFFKIFEIRSSDIGSPETNKTASSFFDKSSILFYFYISEPFVLLHQKRPLLHQLQDRQKADNNFNLIFRAEHFVEARFNFCRKAPNKLDHFLFYGNDFFYSPRRKVHYLRETFDEIFERFKQTFLVYSGRLDKPKLITLHRFPREHWVMGPFRFYIF